MSAWLELVDLPPWLAPVCLVARAVLAVVLGALLVRLFLLCRNR